MKSFTDLQEGLYDPNIFKAFFLAGGPGSGKSYVVKKSTGGTGLKIVNSDDVFEKYLKQARLDFKMQATQGKQRDALRTKAKEVTAKRAGNYLISKLRHSISPQMKQHEIHMQLVRDCTTKSYKKREEL